MYRDHDEHLGSIDQSLISLMAVWCHECQGWRVMAWGAASTAAAPADVLLNKHVDLGPFDGPEQVLEVAQELLRRILELPVAPWVTGQPHW